MKRMNRFIRYLDQGQWADKQPLGDWTIRETSYIAQGVYEETAAETHGRSLEKLTGGAGTTYFLSRSLAVPADWPQQDSVLLYYGTGEGMLSIDGAPYHGLDRNHWLVPLPAAKSGKELQLDIELFDPFPEPVDPLNNQAPVRPQLQSAEIALARINRPVYSLLHTVRMVQESAALLPEADMRRIRLEQALERTMDALYPQPERLADEERVAAAEQELREVALQEGASGAGTGVMHMVGQSHIDVAWLWPLKETMRKVGRTFSTVCALMDRYPDFTYSQSQPQLYAYVKAYYPELYERIKARVAEGRWELVGGMWVEPDLNLPSGESLVRQILYGQGFYEREFGKRSTIEWLPDTFGYCASLPQLLKQAGIDHFMTTKLGWNDTNTFPHTLFDWVGIDGTSVVAYQNHGLNEHTKPVDVQDHWKAYATKDKHDELMLLYGHGDGGGGVTHEMLEYVDRGELMVGQPAGRISTAEEFFAGIDSKQPELPTWHGDLYLELHRGTLTTHAYNKLSNRRAEQLYRRAEIWGRFAELGGTKVAALDGLQEGWELLLLNQFHDIIPGTAIPEVYVTSREQYERVFQLGHEALEQGQTALAAAMHTEGEGQPYVVFNSLGWDRTDTVLIESDAQAGVAFWDVEGELASDVRSVDEETGRTTWAVQVKAVPAFGSRVIWQRPQAESVVAGKTAGAELSDTWETDRWLLHFNARGEITRWLDKVVGRELIADGQRANELQLFYDTPVEWDAWDIDPRFEQQPAEQAELLERSVAITGDVLDVLRFRWRIGSSTVEQDLVFYKHTGRVDFVTKVDWQENHKVLKAAFPVDVLATQATYEIPFGALARPTHRNTTWEQAQFEVCGHRFADLSENGYGVSLLNDCKYGYDVLDGVMRITLLRAPSWPDRDADRGAHAFTYSLYPHRGDWRQAGVVREAAALNEPLQVVATSSHPGTLGTKHAWLSYDSEHVQLDTIKQAEDGSGTIIRMYESGGGRDHAVLRDLPSSARITEVNLLEDELSELSVVDGELKLPFRPYQVRTIKITEAATA
ncbi:alpha-mannosidase [Paenibacillus daejeonensis]|uniref:alpha-mannosidase n=1 Tax=Paenibacillus daejeonensis TaxID=135193 RepID=UPI0003641429|nr:alpha-mannosidase [Paenibacillus daejeonensis]